MKSTPRSAVLFLGLLAPLATAQEWTDDQLVAATKAFQDEALPVRLQQVGSLLAEQSVAFTALVARIHGDHREYMLKVERLLAELGDERWQVREDAERTLIEIGARARSLIEQKKEKFDVLEQQWRCTRILDALTAKGDEQENRELRLLRGLITTSLYVEPEPRLLRALRSALGHTDGSVVEGAIRALGRLGGDDEANAVLQLLDWKGGVHRLGCVAALGRMNCPRALAICKDLLSREQLSATDRMVMLRALRARTDAGALELLSSLGNDSDPVLAAAAKLVLAPATAPTKARFTLPDRNRTQLEAGFGGFLGEATIVHDAVPGMPRSELPFADCDVIDFPAHAITPTNATRVFLNQGSLLAGEVLAISADRLRMRSAWFGELDLPRRQVQGIAVDPSVDRMVGASTEHDRVRLRNGEFVDGQLQAADASSLRIRVADGTERECKLEEVSGILLTRPRAQDPDTTVYQRLDLITGERLIGFLAASSAAELGIVVPEVGGTTLPITAVNHLELGVGGGALWGFTLVADYSENRILEIDDQGREVFALEEIFGAWDAECLDSGNLLITEFSVSRVREVDRKGKDVWQFEDLKNPYDADRLPNGNTLIADTFGSRVIEVDPKHGNQVVWKFDKDIRPFDADRLPNGNTLICNVLKEEVLEVSPAGEVVWRATGLPNVHDADRLPNGNTLVTLRNKGLVLELDRDGKTVWELQGLSSPSDADRLPNGHTLVAENSFVREFDRRGNEVWKRPMVWAVEVNRY